MPYEKILKLMADYDSAKVGSLDRTELGKKLEKEGSRLSERDYWHIVYAYKKMTGEK